MKPADDESSTLLKDVRPYSGDKERRPLKPEEIGEKVLMYMKNLFWVSVGGAVLFYSNFFHHLFRNPNINQVFFEISMAGYTAIVMLILYTSFVLPIFYGVKSIEEYNPKLIPIGAVVGVVAVVSLLVAIWPVWGFTSLPIFIALWKGFFSLSVFMPGGKIGTK